MGEGARGRGGGGRSFSHCLLPSPLSHRFLFRPRFSFRAAESLTLRITKKTKQTNNNKKNSKTTTSYAGYYTAFFSHSLLVSTQRIWKFIEAFWVCNNHISWMPFSMYNGEFFTWPCIYYLQSYERKPQAPNQSIADPFIFLFQHLSPYFLFLI